MTQTTNTHDDFELKTDSIQRKVNSWDTKTIIVQDVANLKKRWEKVIKSTSSSKFLLEAVLGVQRVKGVYDQ